MQRINVLSIQRISAEDRAKIKAVVDRHGAINFFCDNLRAYLEGGPLRNIIEWERGY